MTQQESDQCVAYMSRLFPSMSRDAARLLAIGKAFLPLRAVELRRAIESRVGLDQFPDVPAIVAWCTPPAPRPDPLAAGPMRVNGMSADQVLAERRRAKVLLAERQSQRDELARLDPTTAERLRLAAVERVAADQREFFRGRPLHNPVLMELAIGILDEGGPTA